MSEPAAQLDPGQLFEFVARPGTAVLFLSVHPRHELNRALCDHLREIDGARVSYAVVDLRELLVSASPALSYLHHALRACGAPTSLGVVPGYLLFHDGRLLVWDSGLPTGVDLKSVVKSALLGAIWTGVTGRAAFLGEALYYAAQETTAERMAARFRRAVLDAAAQRKADGDAHARRGPTSRDDVVWAYGVLGLRPSATHEEIRSAWRKRRAESHPDRAASDPAEFERLNRISVEINQARDILYGHLGAP